MLEIRFFYTLKKIITLGGTDKLIPASDYSSTMSSSGFYGIEQSG